MTTNAYHKISVDEFETVLAAYDAERVEVSGTKEFVYDIPTDADGVVVRIFSTLTEGDDGARDVGRDAIRTLAYAPEAGDILGSATRTHRIETWADNLTAKIDAMLARAEAGEFVDPLADTRALAFDTEEGDAGTVYVADLFRNAYDDLRVALDGDTYAAKDTIKGVGWDQTHHKFDPAEKTWNVDATALAAVADALRAEGFALFDTPVEVEDEADETAAVAAERFDAGDDITVTYAKKNGNGEATVAGTVADTDAGRVRFDRAEDGHTMFIQPDGLFTARSSYPYVGDVVAVNAA